MYDPLFMKLCVCVLRFEKKSYFILQGLKKLGHSIETSYSNIQKLVVKHLQV